MSSYIAYIVLGIIAAIVLGLLVWSYRWYKARENRQQQEKEKRMENEENSRWLEHNYSQNQQRKEAPAMPESVISYYPATPTRVHMGLPVWPKLQAQPNGAKSHYYLDDHYSQQQQQQPPLRLGLQSASEHSRPASHNSAQIPVYYWGN
ncbi:hypothetical protein H4S06_005178 [Coemansia sp. BCRC 34490]|nr:hypothetical protein H4S06_005178 [Coemansia sp. BCRC 34490]